MSQMSFILLIDEGTSKMLKTSPKTGLGFIRFITIYWTAKLDIKLGHKP